MFDPVDFLNLAKRLAENGSDEASLRTAVSRAYYAAYLKAFIKISELNLADVVKKPKERQQYFKQQLSEHKAVRLILEKKNHKFASSMLRELFNLRVNADYEINQEVTIEEAERSLELSNRIIQEISGG